MGDHQMGPLDPRRDLIKRLDFLASMYGMGEKIAFGTDQQTALDAITRIEALEAEVERLTAQRDWHQARNDALQKVQRHMRDPERKVVCDILANGTTYVEPFRAALAGEDEP